ncbi:MAG: tetratricopeptide repeat protein [Spirochaetota bacterium]|nr:tetratricopeptide repeat protein [Spirochaetota bacterium]
MANSSSYGLVKKGGRLNLKDLRNKKDGYNKNLVFIFVASFLAALLIAYMAFIYFNTQARIKRLVGDGEYPEAIQQINSILKENPQDLFGLKYKGMIYLKLALNQDMLSLDESKTLEYSIKSLNQVLKSGNKEYSQSDTYFFLGLDYFLMGDQYFEESLKCLEKALELDRKDHLVKKYLKENGLRLRFNSRLYSITLYGLTGYVAFSLERYHLASSYFEKAVQEEGSVVIYHLYLALAYRQQGIYDKALEGLEIVLHREKKKDIVEQAYLTMADIYTSKKEYSQAEKYIKLAQELSSSADSYYLLGLIYETRGQIATAVKHWRKTLSLDGDHDLARKKLVRYGKKYK